MKTNLNLDFFIKKYVVKRHQSLFHKDLIINNDKLKNQINNKSVLVIGGAGTIGSSYIKALLKFTPLKLIVVDVNENGLTELIRDLRSSKYINIPEQLVTYPIDFGDTVFEKIFKKHAPFDIVANFAAHKHVRTEKDIYSIEAMIKNNVFKLKTLLKLLLRFPPNHFFCVSSDKATNPVNIMGASKKLMEELIMAYSSRLSIKTARFANVAFSNGSLLQGFLERFNNHQALACPTDIKRFFLSPEESGQLCLIASVIGKSGDILFPKLDKIKDTLFFDRIVYDLLNYMELEIDICESEEEAKRKSELLTINSNTYPVYFFKSDTSGEKLFEEFYMDNEILDLKTFESIGIIKKSSQLNENDIEIICDKLEKIFLKDNILKTDIVKILETYLVSFKHFETGKNLDERM